MLEKIGIASLNKFDSLFSKDKILDIYWLLFPKMMVSAFKKGIFRTYKSQSFNNMKLRGRIDFHKHITKNYFPDKIAYSIRELTFDNIVNQTIRHTFEFLLQKRKSRDLIRKNLNLIKIYNSIVQVTSSYDPLCRNKILDQAKKTNISSTFYKDYKKLLELCIRILENDKISPNNNSTLPICGIIFDGSYLWEEYLNVIVGEKSSNNRKFDQHPSNVLKTNNEYLFVDNKTQRIYPDFLNTEQRIIADAKYKPTENIGREDYYQVITYVYRYDYYLGLFLFPIKSNEDEKKFNEKVNNLDKIPLSKICLKISSLDNYVDFKKEMEINEKDFIKKIQNKIDEFKVHTANNKHFDELIYDAFSSLSNEDRELIKAKGKLWEKNSK